MDEGAGPSASVIVDNTRPTFTLSDPDDLFINSSSVSNFTVTYSDYDNVQANITLDPSDISLNTSGDATCNTIIVTGTGDSRNIALSDCTGDGTVGITLSSGTVNDLAGNLALASAPSGTFEVDNTPPTIQLADLDNPIINQSGTSNFIVTYSGHQSISLTESDINLITTGDATCATILVSGSGNSRNVALSNCSGDGSVGINVSEGTAVDVADNLAQSSGNSASFFVVDNSPVIITISETPTNGHVNILGLTSFSVTYAEHETISLTSADVNLNTTGTATCDDITISGSGDIRSVNFANCSGDGTVGFFLSPNTADDIAGNGAPASENSNTFVVDNTPPPFIILAPDDPLINVAGVSNFVVNYSEHSAITLSESDITQNTTGTATCGTIIVSGAGDSRTVSLSGCSGDGTVGITIDSGTSVDLAGNFALVSSPSDTFEVDNTPPSVTITGPDDFFINSTGTSSFLVSYSADSGGNPNITLSESDVELNLTGGVSCTTKTISGTGNSRTVSVSGCLGDGTVSISVNPNTASDSFGHLAAGAGPSATFEVDNTPPTLSFVGPSDLDVNSTSFSEFVVTYTNFSSISLTDVDVNLNTTGDATCASVVVSNPGPAESRTITLSECTGDGTVGLDLSAGTATDLADNLAAASPDTGTFNIDNTPPSISFSTPSESLVNSGDVITFTVTYIGHASISLVSNDVNLNTTGTATCGTPLVTGTNPNDRIITLSNCTGDGTVGINLNSGTAIDVAENLALASGDSITFQVDNTPPGIIINGPTPLSINSTDVAAYTITYSNFTALTLIESDIQLNPTGSVVCSNKSISITGADTRNLSVSDCTGDGTVSITVKNGTAVDEAGNLALTEGPSNTVAVDNTPPTVTIGSVPTNGTVNNSGSSIFHVTYSGANNVTLTEQDVNLVTTNGATCSVSVAGVGLNKTITLSSCTGNGTVGFNLNPGTASDEVGNQVAGTGDSTTIVVDNTAPSFVISAPSNSIINGSGSSTYTVTYTGASSISLTEGDVNLNVVDATCGTIDIGGSGLTTRTITLSDCTGNGTVGIDLDAGTASDLGGNTAPSTSNSATFTVDNVAPTLSVSGASLANVRNGVSTAYTVTYSGANSVTLSNTNISLNTTGGATCSHNVSGSGTSTRTVTLSSCSGNGTVRIAIAAGTASDHAGNTASGVTSASFNVDNSAPTLSVSGASLANVRNGVSTAYTVTYSGANSVTLSNTNISLNTTGGATCSHNVSGSGTSTRTVTLSSCSGNGTVRIAIAAGTASDHAGNTASGVTSASFNVDNSAPTLSVSGASLANVRNGVSTAYTVTYSGASSVTLSNTDITLNNTGGANCSYNVTGSGTTTRTVTLSSCTGNGTVKIVLASSTAVDSAGNLSASTDSSTFNVDNTAPTLSISGPSNANVRNTTSTAYTVTYTGANAVTLANANVSLNTTGGATCSRNVSGSGTTSRTVTLSSCTGNGTVGISIASGTASDVAGNTASSAGPSTAFNVDTIKPTVSIGSPSMTDATSTDTVTYTLTYEVAPSPALVAGDISLGGTNSDGCYVSGIASPGTTNPVVSITGCTGSGGTVNLSVLAGSSSDVAGNTDNGAGPSNTFNVVRSLTIYSNKYAFAALKSDGSVVTWGHIFFGGNSSSVSSSLTSGVTKIFSNTYAFAALKTDGSVVTWGYRYHGGDSSSVSSSLTSGVVEIFSTNAAFAALKNDGSVVTWPSITGYSAVSSSLASGVTKIFSTNYTFAALKNDGSVVTWGHSTYGGDSSSVSSSLTSGVSEIFSTNTAFAALKTDGSVVTWGWNGGNSSSVSSSLTSGVTKIFATQGAFAALKNDGSVVTWPSITGYSAVSSSLASGVTKIFATQQAFAALKTDGSVVTWGHSTYGGDSSSVSSSLTSGVVEIFSTWYAFAALKTDGSVVTWGSVDHGGDSSSVSSSLTSGVTEIFSNPYNFAALKTDGSVVTWGCPFNHGGDSSSVSSSLTSGVTKIFATEGAFAALKEDGSVVTWGDSNYGGDSSAVSDILNP